MLEKVIGPIHYYTNDSNGSCLLFLHPAFLDHRVFDQQERFFVHTHKIIFIDIIGHGHSLEKGKIDDMHYYINEILHQEGILKAHVIGIGLGGLIAQDFANHYPKKLSSLILSHCIDINNTNKKEYKTYYHKQKQLIKTGKLSIKNLSKEASQYYTNSLTGRLQYQEICLDYPKKGFKRLKRVKHILDRFELYHRSYPLYFIEGEKDEFLDEMKKWKDREQCKILIIKNAGSILNLDAPTTYNKVILKQISQIKEDI